MTKLLAQIYEQLSSGVHFFKAMTARTAKLSMNIGKVCKLVHLGIVLHNLIIKYV